MSKKDCESYSRGRYSLTYDGMRHALRRHGAVCAYGLKCKPTPLDAKERKAAGRFVSANQGRRWCVSKWRQEIGNAIGRNCLSIPFEDVREILHERCVRPIKLPSNTLDSKTIHSGNSIR